MIIALTSSLAISLCLAASLPVAKAPQPAPALATTPPDDIDFSDDALDPVPPIPNGTTTVTFGMPQPVVGQVCVDRSNGNVMLSGPAALLSAFGEERGGDHVTEVTVLEVRADGKLQKARYRFLVDTLYASLNGIRQPIRRATRGQTYILTRKDDEGWFEAAREDGGAISEQERQELRAHLDHRFPGVLDGRTMTLGHKVKFNDEELHRYFAFEDSAGMKVKAHEMKLGAIEGNFARIDVKVVFDVNATNGEADVTAYATMRSDLAQHRVVTYVEGPVRLEVPGAVNGLGAPAAAGAAGPAPIVLKGTFHMEDTVLCKLPKH